MADRANQTARAAVSPARWRLTAHAASRNPSDGTPAARACGAGKDFLIGMSQANNAEPYRQVMNNDVQTAAKAVPGFTRRGRRRGAGQQQAGRRRGELPHPEDRPADHLAERGQAADRRGEEGVRPGRAGASCWTARWRARRTPRSSAATTSRSAGRPASSTPTTLLPDGGKVIEIAGLPGSTPAAERAQGFRDGHRRQPEDRDRRLPARRLAAGEGPVGGGRAAQGPPGRVAPSTPTTTRWPRAPTWPRRRPGAERRIKFTGIDALPVPSGGIKAVEQGRLAATFQYATGGREAVELARKILVDCADGRPAHHHARHHADHQGERRRGVRQARRPLSARPVPPSAPSRPTRGSCP